LRPLRRQQRFDQVPQLIGQERLGHAAHNSPLAPSFPVLLGILNRNRLFVRQREFHHAAIVRQVEIG
ncbi:MAG: hypothetical protein AB7O13_25435, partial [Alphaproteobacteria bacterium]